MTFYTDKRRLNYFSLSLIVFEIPASATYAQNKNLSVLDCLRNKSHCYRITVCSVSGTTYSIT